MITFRTINKKILFNRINNILTNYNNYYQFEEFSNVKRVVLEDIFSFNSFCSINSVPFFCLTFLDAE